MPKLKVSKVAKALSDETRCKIFELIARSKEISCKEITEKIGLRQPTISHHLKTLQESGLVNVRKEGQFHYFSVNKEVVENFANYLLKFTN
ncbi:ArsR/SmtB family transcription factor [Candidatus Chrysopegis kryptomonas]|uniref:ArsR family transcriptional regulator n=1 Tax=Candidatus Chryseopegocella kryptomonas TaxID=1633643 RepID=A0A0P1MPP8_9BACT|nr:metalloregulator ArsR/SmtB family transcription factor [Candidatus Chrysopegis kryptomonas]CUS97790.1 ArsR family transcriptional regulator [Candidatus Chrysopegis kryptomonas]